MSGSLVGTWEPAQAMAGPVQVRSSGPVRASEVRYARTRVAAALERSRWPVLSLQVRLTRLTDPAASRPAVAQANVRLDGRLLRAQAARATMSAAVDEVHDRLREQLRRLHGPGTGRGHHRDGSGPAGPVPAGEQPPVFPGPGERRIVRRKTPVLGRLAVAEAVDLLAGLDYRFLLFVEADSGADCLLSVTDDDTAYLLRAAAGRPDAALGDLPVRVDPTPAPVLTSPHAVDRLLLSGRPHVFFRDAGAGRRGSVVYVRYDGQLGLVRPAP